MNLGTPEKDLLRGVLIERYKRFFADCRLDSGEFVTAHCPNTGSMKTLLEKKRPVWLKTHDNPRRKLPYTLTLLGVENDGWALVDTSLPNHIVVEGIQASRCPGLEGYSTLKTEVPYGSRKSRIDILLADRDASFADERGCYVEVKNVTMASATTQGRADFPDSKTERGLKHLKELADMVDAGFRCVQFYLLGRTDCDHIGVAEEIDPKYAAGLREAMSRGVEVICQRLSVHGSDVEVGEICDLDFS